MSSKAAIEQEASKQVVQRFHPKFGANTIPSQNTSDTMRGIILSGTPTRTDNHKYRDDDDDG